MTLKQLIKKLSSKYKTRDPFELAESIGCIIIFAPLKGPRGMHQYIKRTNIIYIDSNLDETASRFVCAHELGHLLLHKGINRIFLDTNTYLVSGKFEIEADRFAAELLYEDNEFIDLLDYTIQQISNCLGLREDLVEYRLNQLDIQQPKEWYEE